MSIFLQKKIIKKIYQYYNKFYYVIYFIVINIIYSICLKNIPEIFFENNISISSVSKKHMKEILLIYSYFNNSDQLDIAKRFIYFLFSSKLVFVAHDMVTHTIVGIELYYFNKKDTQEKTIHQGFRGVLPEWQNKGIGTMITQHAIHHFKTTNLSGISSRVSLHNLASLKSNMKLGFKPIKKYFDENMNENRYYLICPFNKNDHREHLS